MIRRVGALATLALAGCASAPPARPVVAQATPFDEAAAARALEGLVAALPGESVASRNLAREMGLALDDARGRRAITGEPDRDDAVREATAVTRVGDVAAALVTSRCGNAWLVPLRWQGRWLAQNSIALVNGAHPGACRLTEVRAEAAAVSSSAPREVLVAWSSEDEDGDSPRRTTFSALRLTPRGSLVDLTGPVPLGGEDDATGAVRAGSWFVDDVVPPPRDIVLEVRPSRPGPGGAGEASIERQVWRPRGEALERVEVVTEAVVSRPRADGFARPR